MKYLLQKVNYFNKTAKLNLVKKFHAHVSVNAIKNEIKFKGEVNFQQLRHIDTT